MFPINRLSMFEGFHSNQRHFIEVSDNMIDNVFGRVFFALTMFLKSFFFIAPTWADFGRFEFLTFFALWFRLQVFVYFLVYVAPHSYEQMLG